MSARTRLILLALAVATIATMLLISRCSTGADRAAQPAPVQPAAASAAAPSPAGTEAPDAPEEDGAADTSDMPAVITAGPAEAKEAAIQVVVKLLNTTGKTAEQWRAGLRPYVSAALFDSLADSDPQTAPVGRVDDGRVTVAVAGDELVQASVPVIDGSQPPRVVATIRVTMSGASHRWVATELDVVPA